MNKWLQYTHFQIDTASKERLHNYFLLKAFPFGMIEDIRG